MSRLFRRNSIELSAIIFFATAAFFIAIQDYMATGVVIILEVLGDLFDPNGGIYAWLESQRMSVYKDGLGIIMLVLSIAITFWIVRKLAR